MTTKNESDFPSSPPNDESGDEEQDIDQDDQEEVTAKKPAANVASILARLQSSGALIKKPKQEYHCFTCDIDFSDWEELENHLIKHVSIPFVVLDKLQSGEEDLPPSGDENWSDDEDVPVPPKDNAPKAPKKIDISQILKKTGVSFKKKNDNEATSSDSALNKLSGLGFTITKNTTSIKKEKPENDTEKTNDVMQKLGKLGGIKLKLKSDGNNSNSFKVINGLKDFKASDDEDEASGNEDEKEEQEDDDENDKSAENEGSGGEEEDSDNQIANLRNNRDFDITKKVVPNLYKGIQAKFILPKKEPVAVPNKMTPIKIQQEETAKVKPPNRPAVKQTPKRVLTAPIAAKEPPKIVELPTSRRPSENVTPERRESNDRVENVVVKQEVPDVTGEYVQNNILPMSTNQIKSERSSPPPLSERTTPVLAHVKSEPEIPTTAASSHAEFNTQNTQSYKSLPNLFPVTKTEDMGVTVIEINGDSNDEDDDCCVVSTTPAPDVKPLVPKTENPPSSYSKIENPPPPYPTAPITPYSTSQPSYNSPPGLTPRLPTPSTEKQHNFNWNAPDSKSSIDILEKSTDDIFESLLSSATKKENIPSLSDVSEYVSLDSLGPQHSCDICNTRFTDISLLDEHRRVTGHSKSLVAPSSSSLMPYNHSSNILSSLLPVKQLAEQVGKLSTIGNSGPGFTHQQNVMINIQTYPGAGGVPMVPPQYNTYNSGQNMHGYQQPSSNMYGPAGPPTMSIPNQYQGSNYMNQGYGQYPPTPMSKSSYPGSMSSNSYSMASSPYSTTSPLQSMQQSVYGQAPGAMNPPGSMGPPGSSPSHAPYASSSSPGGGIKQIPGSNVKIQNIQTFPPGQMMGPSGQPQSGPELGPGQMPPLSSVIPGGTPIRMAVGANMGGPRPRLPTVRGQRPTIRPGIQVHGQIRGGKAGPRMPMKRPGGAISGPTQKRRPDMLLPGKHDNEDCQVMAMQKQREGLPMIQSVQGAKDKLNLGSQISITKKTVTVNKEANAMANVLASRGISVKQKQKSRSPTPERPLPHIPNLGAGVSIKHTSKSSNFSIPEAKVGGGMYSCKICKKMFMNHTSLQVHMANAHPQSNKIPVFKCDECPASYPKSLQLQHHKRVFHNVTGPNRELGLPVVDLSQEDNLKRLSNLGIYSFIPLANREQANGCFGIPVISVHNMQNGLSSSLQALGADGLLSLGPLKPLPNT